ncbi:MAG: 2-amino-4-hydroxy-6-hydroxymethyldihydropteridine diphosphokinase [Planctomycetota bacterium]
MTIACIALGSNLGDRAAAIRGALELLNATNGIGVRAVSDVVETEPVGPPGQGPYLNAAAELQTSIPDPRALLWTMLDIERQLGRDRSRSQRWGPRTIDLDLLTFGESVLNEPELTLPHPRLHERTFVLVPLAQIAPDTVIPGLDSTPTKLLTDLRDAAPPAAAP